MAGISIHAVDVTQGLPAAGLKVVIFQVDAEVNPIAEGALTAQGTFDHPIVHQKLTSGVYEVVFYVGDFYRQLAFPLPNPPFLDVVPYRFGLGDPEQHYHLPLKLSPWGFSLFRGG